jgi:4-hydroxy-3-methylbut-2-enyl diphosphate reductase
MANVIVFAARITARWWLVMKVFLGTPRGFCAGVVRAVDVVELALARYGAPVYVKHQIVHNPHVVNSLEQKGARTVEDVDDIPEGSTVVFSAHGSPPEDFAKAARRNLQVIDATCPLVTKVHNEAHKYAREGRGLLLVGHRGHQEVKGSMGQQPMHLVDDRKDSALPDWDSDTPVAVLTQTTLSVDDTRRAIDDIRARFTNVIVRNDLCYATTNRQLSVKELCRSVELLLVIGAPESSNCNRLREVASAHGVTAYLINGPEDLDHRWLDGVENVGVTSGASTPELLVDAVIEAIKPDEVVVLKGAEEDVSFVLPKEFRDEA